MTRRCRAVTLIEMLVGGMLALILGAAVVGLTYSTYDSRDVVMDQNTATTDARQAVDTIADRIRGASGLTQATASSVTFTAPDGTVCYWLDGGTGTLRTTLNGQPGGGSVVAGGVEMLSFTYLTYASGSWESSTAPGDPAAVGAVAVTARVRVDGSVREFGSSIQIRQKRPSSG